MDLGDASIVPMPKSLEDKYVEEMKKLQFGNHAISIAFLYCDVPLQRSHISALFIVAFFDFTAENEDGNGISFTVSYHYENNVKQNYAKSFPARLKRRPKKVSPCQIRYQLPTEAQFSSGVTRTVLM